MPARNAPPEVPGGFDGYVERRGSPRGYYLLTEGMIFVDVAPLGTPAMLVDLSENGLGIQFGVPVPNVQELELEFPVDQDTITARCALVWSSRTAWGLKFLELGEEAKAKIRGWVDRSVLQECPITPEGTFSSAGNDSPPEGDRANSSDEHEQSGAESERIASNAPPVLSARAIGPTLPVAEPAATDDLPEIRTLSSSDQGISGGPESFRGANLNNAPPERDVGVTPPVSRLGAIATGDGRNGGQTSVGPHDWVERLKARQARQKQAREELISAARSHYDQEDVFRLQSPPLPPDHEFHDFGEAQKLAHPELLPVVHSHDDEQDSTPLETASSQPPAPVFHDFDKAIRELRAATGSPANKSSRGRPGFLNGAAGDGETELRRAMPIISVVVALAVIVLGAFAGFLYATWVSPPAPVPLPSAVLGFGAIRAAKRFAIPTGWHPRSSGEFLLLGDRCLNGNKRNCGCPTAVESFEAAAILGHPGGLERMATLYSTGECVSANRVQAYRAFQQALASDPNPWVQWNLDSLWARMTPKEQDQVSVPQHR